jgi:hypothetical protein
MDSDNIFPIKGPDNETEEAFRNRQELTEKIYAAILPLLGPNQAQELLKMFNSRFSSGLKADLQPVVDQSCELCHGPMKIEENGDEFHFITSCIHCGYMDVFKK